MLLTIHIFGLKMHSKLTLKSAQMAVLNSYFSVFMALGIYNFVCAFTGAETTFGPFVLFSSTTEQTNLMMRQQTRSHRTTVSLLCEKEGYLQPEQVGLNTHFRNICLCFGQYGSRGLMPIIMMS